MSGWSFLGKLVGGVVITGAAIYGGVRVYAAIPPSPLTDEEQARLKAGGIVWASPDAPVPAGVEHMILLSKDVIEKDSQEFEKNPVGWQPKHTGLVCGTEIRLGVIRLAKLVAAGWRFWRPKTPEDALKEATAAKAALGGAKVA